MHLFLLWLGLAMQAPGGPALPVALEQDEAVVTAWQAAGTAESPEARLQAARIVFDALPKVREAAQLDFLLRCEAADAVTPALLLEGYERLRRDWEGFPSAVAARIAGAEVTPELRRGAARAAQRVPLTDPAVMTALGSRLAAVDGGADARAALVAITGRDFAQEADFLSWWEGAQGKSREAWLQASLAASRAQTIADWRSRLAANPDDAVFAVEHPNAEVRFLGYNTLLSKRPAEGRPSDSPEARAIIKRMQDETVPEYRRLIIRMVTRFLQGQAAVSQLSVAVDRGSGEEKELAVSQLRNVQPPAVALEAFRAQLALAYPQETTLPLDNRGYRTQLWNGLAGLVREARPSAAALESFQSDLLACLSLEPDPEVKGYFYEAAGEIGAPGFIASLENYLRVKERSVGERKDALGAMTRIAQRTGEVGGLREMLPRLLADEDRAIRRRAIQSYGQLALPEGPELLIARLPLEAESGLQADILGALRERAAPETLEPLLALQPARPFEASYVQTLAAVVGKDWGRLTRALDELGAQRRYGDARGLIKLFPAPDLTPAQGDTLARREARVLARYLLQVGIDKQSPATVTDAVNRLNEQATMAPTDPEWQMLYVRLQLARGEVSDAIVWMESRVLTNPQVAEIEKWGLALACLRSARAQGRLDAGRGLIAGLGEPPAEYRYLAEQEMRFFREPPAEAPEAGGEEPLADEPVVPGSGDAGGGPQR